MEKSRLSALEVAVAFAGALTLALTYDWFWGFLLTAIVLAFYDQWKRRSSRSV